ncbi:MAG: GMC family oxidoreductase [Saprospiraceae bacterium]|nr:GMC family oxidoreductase [Saprospiraceae bacterium]
MIPIFTMKGYTSVDPLDGLSNAKRTLLHMLVCTAFTILLIFLIDPVFKIVFFKNFCSQIAEVVLFGVIYAFIIVQIRKSSSLVHYFIIFLPLYIADLYLETHCMRSLEDKAIWNYYPESFVYKIEPIAWRYFITISFDGLLLGPVCLWFSRLIASLLVKKQSARFDAAYHKLFNEERTEDRLIVLPKRILLKSNGSNILKRIDFDFWILRLLGIFFLIYLSILIAGSVGSVSLNSQKLLWPEQLAKLISDTYTNAFHHVHTIGKISNFILLAMIAAFHTGIRFFAVRIFMLGNLVAAICSFYLYYFSSGEDFLFQSGIVDSAVTLLSFVLYLRSRNEFDKTLFEQKYKTKDATIAEQLLMLVYFVAFLMFTLLFVFLVAGFLWGSEGSELFRIWYKLIQAPESMLLNSITFSFTTALIAYYCFRYKGVRMIFTHNLTDPLIFSSITAALWLIYFYLNNGFIPGYLKPYLFIYLLINGSLIFLIRKARSLYYNMDLQITTLHPSEADTAQAFVTAIYGDDNVNALAAAGKTDKFIASIRGRKRGLINFPFYILENILCPLMALRPRFSNMSLEERCFFLKKYILRFPAEISKAFSPEISNIANKIGISLKAISSLSYLSTPQGRDFLNYIEPERRNRYAGCLPSSPAPFSHVPSMPENESDPLNFKPGMSVNPESLMANHLSSSQADADHLSTYDYVIIGSGAAGAVMAYRLACCENIDPSKILLVERGSRVSRHTDMNDDEMDMLARLYKEGGLQQTKKFDMVVLQGETLGGTTVINNAVCLEMPMATRDAWNKDFGIPLNAIQKHYDRIRKEINIHPIDHNAINQKVATKFRNAVSAFNQQHDHILDLIDPLEVNARSEDGDGLWNLGNKRGKKLSMESTYIPWAEAKGVHVMTQADALKFITDEASDTGQLNKRARAILVQTSRGIEEISVHKSLVICGGCIASTHLIMRSSEHELKNEAVGKNLACNYAFPFAFEFEDELKAFDGTQITMAALHKSENYIFETYYNPPAAFAITLPFNFETHRNVLKRYSNCLNFGVLIGSSNVGTIDRKYDRITGRAFEFDLSGTDDLRKIKSAIRDMVELGKLAGARYVVIPMNPGLRIDLLDPHAYDGFIKDFEAYDLKQSDLILSTAHPQGGNSMTGKNSLPGVVGTDFKLNGYDNVYVTDASIFPASIGVNPQWTIMALSSMASEIIGCDLK